MRIILELIPADPAKNVAWERGNEESERKALIAVKNLGIELWGQASYYMNDVLQTHIWNGFVCFSYEQIRAYFMN